MKDRRAPFRFRDRLRSFGPAGRGMLELILSQHNAWIHVGMTVFVIATGLGLGVSMVEWRWLIACMAGVWITEAFNTVVELLCDVLHPEHNPRVGLAKDISAGAVLMASIAAAVVWLMIFVPHALALIH